MKKLLYIFIFILFNSCTKVGDFNNSSFENGENITLNFSIDIPEPELVVSRAINENLISNLHLLVFDENGLFISSHQSIINASNYTTTLPLSNKKRIIHFIANYDWSGFDESAYIDKDENEIINLLHTTNLTFWQRIELESGINSNIFSAPVSLIRNMAKFTVSNQSSSGLNNVKFAIFNIASKGTVAPFNTTSKEFSSIITEPANITYDSSTAFGEDAAFVFERKNSTVTTNPTYVIIEGRYRGTIYYYKIDIIDENNNIYDLKRNTWFNVSIDRVRTEGYTTIEEAKNSPASNNIYASVLLQSFPSISDGRNVLSVDKTFATFITDGQILQANATYKSSNGIIKNSEVNVTLNQDINNPVVINGGVTYDVSTGNISANINDVPVDGTSYTATINIRAGNLSRTIRLLLQPPFVFDNVSMIDNILKFTIPEDADYLIPFYCYISTEYFTPTLDNIEIVNENGIYKYKWKVENTGEQTINLEPNAANSSEMIKIDADLFEQGQVVYSNSGSINHFTDVILFPNPVDFGIGRNVVLNFTVPTAGTYYIHTDNLTDDNNSIINGVLEYMAVEAGEQIVNFITNNNNSNETIKITGENYNEYQIKLKNQLINLTGIILYQNYPLAGYPITLSVNNNVIGYAITDSNGYFETLIEANIGEELLFSYGSISGSVELTSPQSYVTVHIY